MSIYSGLAYVEAKIECRNHGIPTYGKKSVLKPKLLEALVKRTKSHSTTWAPRPEKHSIPP